MSFGNPTLTAPLGITIGVCLIIFALFVSFWIRWDSRSIAQGPALLTMVGIAGTFFGIAWGLRSFNPDNVADSIPNLIDGIKTAVWASCLGVVTAILLKVRYAFEGGTPEAEGASDGEMIASQLAALQRAITGDDEATVISQMKLARMDTNDRLDAIRKSQDAFLERLSEMSSKTLVEALRDVIRDFNAKINEQFGENFKQLNEAVGRLLTWQEEYRRQLDELITVERESATEMKTAVAHYREALTSTQSLLAVAEQFSSILDGIDAYKANLRDNTERLASLVETMRTATPALRTEIEGLVKAVTESVAHSEAEVARVSQEISQKFREAADAVRNDLTSALATANKEVNDNVTRLVGSTTELTEQLQMGLEESLNESLRTLAQQLASLSNRFAEDYGPIADRLREIVMASS
jgi:DNA anti-recombination protein RmuC